MPQEMIRVGLVGVTGYTGMELARLLTGHPNMKLTAATSRFISRQAKISY